MKPEFDLMMLVTILAEQNNNTESSTFELLVNYHDKELGEVLKTLEFEAVIDDRFIQVMDDAEIRVEGPIRWSMVKYNDEEFLFWNREQWLQFKGADTTTFGYKSGDILARVMKV